MLGLEWPFSHARRPNPMLPEEERSIFEIAVFLAFSKWSVQRTDPNRDIECVGIFSNLQNVPPGTTLNGDVGAYK